MYGTDNYIFIKDFISNNKVALLKQMHTDNHKKCGDLTYLTSIINQSGAFSVTRKINLHLMDRNFS